MGWYIVASECYTDVFIKTTQKLQVFQSTPSTRSSYNCTKLQYICTEVSQNRAENCWIASWFWMLNRVCKNQCLPSSPPQIWLLLWSSVCFNVKVQKDGWGEKPFLLHLKTIWWLFAVLHFLRHTIISGRLSRGEACGCRIWEEVLKARALLIEQHPLLCTFKESGLNFLPHVLELHGYQATFLYIT